MKLHIKTMCFLLMGINTDCHLRATCTQIRYRSSPLSGLEALISRVCQANEPKGTSGLRARSVCSRGQHTKTGLTHVARKCSSVNTDPCERLGFMELMGGCMGTLPGGSFALFFWWRRSRRRPSSSHQEDRRAGKREECVSAVGFLGK